MFNKWYVSDMNFSKNSFYTHKKDYIFYSTDVEGQSVEVFVTKLYKLVKIRDKFELKKVDVKVLTIYANEQNLPWEQQNQDV